MESCPFRIARAAAAASSSLAKEAGRTSSKISTKNHGDGTNRVKELLSADAHNMWHPYTSLIQPTRTRLVESASGCKFYLADGNSDRQIEVVDGMSNWWAAVHGHAVKELDSAAASQLGKMSHVMFGGLTHEPAVTLGNKLVDFTPDPLTRVFLCDSGSVSVEVAIKMAFQYWAARGVTGKTKLLTVRGGYHGDTFGAMAVCDPENGMHATMFGGGMLASHIFAPRPGPKHGEPCPAEEATISEFARLLKENEDCIAGVIMEPIVQGAGGMRFYSADYLKHVRELCDKHGVLLILDEIATGFGRSGELFGCHHAGISPDIMCLGKALTGGYMTMGATIATDEVAFGVSGGIDGDNSVPLMHGPTFMGNPLACSVANASVDLLLSTPWQDRVRAIERQLRSELLDPCEDMPSVQDARALGAIGVLEMKDPLGPDDQDFLVNECGVWLRPFGKLLYTMPPFIIGEEELRKITNAMRMLAERRCA